MVAVKVGMLADSQIIEIVADKIKQYQPKHLVIDPVMVATSGDLLHQYHHAKTKADSACGIVPNAEGAALTGKAVA
ncbi:bifunctional hydroxymethylpyrimidine kinase/phosphomethylpyrimidine kinase [Vibrio chagasii]|nr:bifunctional hydroxymethylpyrimidine kinase/phosphomethylpyrimidine kinase [Vibrio chagasii]